MAPHGCEALRTTTERNAGSCSWRREHTRICLTRSNVSREMSPECRVPVSHRKTTKLHRSTFPQLTSATQHPDATAPCQGSRVDQNILETSLAFVAVHGQHSWVLLSTETQPAPFFVSRHTFLFCFHPPRRLTSPSDLNFVALSTEAPEGQH